MCNDDIDIRLTCDEWQDRLHELYMIAEIVRELTNEEKEEIIRLEQELKDMIS